MSPWSTRKWTSAIGTRQFTMAFSLPNIVIKPDLETLLYGYRPCVLPCPKTQEHQSTCVDSWVHGVPENGHQPLGRGNSLWRSACPILWSNPILKRYFMDNAHVYSLALKLRNTTVPVWTHESMGFPKWTSAIGTRQFTMAFSLPNIVIKPDLETLLYGYRPCVLPCPKTQEHRSTCVDSWVHGVYENGHQLLGRGNSLWLSWGIRKWTSAIGTRQFTMALSLPNIVIKPDLETLLYGYRPCALPSPKTQEQQRTCVDSWLHRVPENGHQPLGRGNSLWRSACLIMWSNPILKRYFMDIASVYSLVLRLRNTKVPVWTHESLGYPKMDISHWDAAIHYGVQLAQYCDQTRRCSASLRRLPPVYSFALRPRNTKVPVWTHESMEYPKMDISHWDAAIHYGVQFAQYCDQTRSWNATLWISPLCTPLP